MKTTSIPPTPRRLENGLMTAYRMLRTGGVPALQAMDICRKAQRCYSCPTNYDIANHIRWAQSDARQLDCSYRTFGK